MNSNAIHNLINIVLTVLGALMMFDWSVFGFSPEAIASFMGVLAFIKLVMNAVRDGLSNLFSPQPPVETK